MCVFCVLEKTNKISLRKYTKEKFQEKINYFLSGVFCGLLSQFRVYSLSKLSRFPRNEHPAPWFSSSCDLTPLICSPFYTKFFCFYICENFFSYTKDWKKENRVFCVFSVESNLIFHFPFFSFSQKLWQRPARKCSSKETESLKRRPRKVRDAFKTAR